VHRDSIKRLVVRGPNWIGDAVMSEPALAAVRSLFPKAEITLLVKPPIAALLKGHPALNRIMLYEDRGDHAGLMGKWVLAGALRRQGFDLAILFQNAFEAALLAFLAGIPRRYGYATDGRGCLLSDPVAVPKREGGGHQVRYYHDLLRPLGAEGHSPAPRLFVSAQEELDLRQKLAQAGIAESDPVIGLNPGSSYGGAKRWLPERFAEVADRLASEWGWRVVIVGAKGEEALGRAIAERMQRASVVLSGQTSIRELMAAIHRCRLFITNDTGPMHMAAAFGVPVVAVFGPTDHLNTSPFGADHAVVRHPVECSPCLLRECPIDHRCMTGVTVERVYAAAVQQLQVSKLASSKCSDRRSEVSQASSLSACQLGPVSAQLKGVTVFLDRDGTLNLDTGYVKTVDELELLPGVAEAVAKLNKAGARVVVITNQSGIARGFLTTAVLETIHSRLRELLLAGGASLDAIYLCPHHPDDGCACRKPQSALVDRAVAEMGLDLSKAYMVGDQKRDMELAERIGARRVLVLTGPTSVEAKASLEADGLSLDYVAPGLSEAVDWVLVHAQRSASALAGRSLQSASGSVQSDFARH